MGGGVVRVGLVGYLLCFATVPLVLSHRNAREDRLRVVGVVVMVRDEVM